jgi:5-methylcytosine-specific restriction endonuclease McrA
VQKSYKEQLRDRRWQIKRNKILDRDKHTCQNKNCNYREDTSILLEVHHLDYLDNTMAWDYPDDMLITLCSVCHKSEQLRPKEEKYLINTLRMKGFLLSDLLAHATLIDTSDVFCLNLLKILREFQKK